ncbi:MAG: cache domain-containing protein, partial [Leptospiraceae bacterium]|nr:cache domain-containing protein [Leptospiraceae bacterium]
MSEKGNLYKNKGFWHKVSRLSIRKKMNFVGLLVVGIFALILFLRVLPLLEKGKLEERRGKLRAVVNSVTSLMDYYERSIRSRAWENDPSMPKTIEEAKKLVIKNIRQMRYDKTEYFFIMDGKGNMVMHPLKPELEGKNLMDKKDPDGNLIFREMVLNSQRDSEAFVSYVWQSKYSPIIFEPQTTYARYFWAWDWVVCSGVYTQDILDSMKEINYLSAGYIVATSALTVVLLFGFVYFNLTKPLTRLLMAIEEISKNNLDYKVQPFFDDELGHISEQFNEMVQHRKRSQEELTQLNASLEDKVIQRTSELSDSLKQVNALKVQQDGDYFLTALLVKPLQSEQNESKRIVTKSHIEQYKQFVFRKWKNEIGGDICITDNIVLNGRDYVFFVNADAMGKSIQGAGGVLLFGASVKAHLIQTKAGKTFTALPELWLKNLYLDLNQLFKTFDGSMLISAAIGLIDELTGVMYYLNAEHPWPVLYRDGVASFLEDNLSLRKV